MSFGELLVVAVLGLVVLGPKELPKVLRTLGRTVAKLRRMSRDLRQQSGIDEIIRAEGLEEELATLRSLRGMSPSGLVDSFIENSSQRTKKLAVLAAAAAPLSDEPYGADAAPAPELPPVQLAGTAPEPKDEYPEIGCDAYGALAVVLPATVLPEVVPVEVVLPEVVEPLAGAS